MKIILLLFLLLLEVNFLYAQEPALDSLGNEIRGDTIYFEKLIPEFEVVPCFALILNSIVESEKAEKYLYQSRFYSLATTSRVNGTDTIRLISIGASKWKYANSLNYSGYMIIKGIYFLLQGDYEMSAIFKKCPGSAGTICLQRPVSDDFPPLYKCLPDFVGHYRGCKQEKLYFFFTLESKIEKYFRIKRYKEAKKGK